MKQKVHTDFITTLLKKTLGEESDTGSLPVFEVIATSSVPLKKKGLYENAVISDLTLAQMAQAVNQQAIPLMLDHNMEGTPKGKFFYAELRQDSGRGELRGLFYIDPIETELVAKANTGTLDETSVGFLPSSLKCSKCQFDYMGALRAGNVEPLLNKTCPSKHILNKDGTHAVVDGLEDFMELSLVSRGAAPNSKIIGNDNAKLGLDVTKLAASGFDVNELYITASASEGVKQVDLSELIAKLGSTTTDLALKSAEVTGLTLRATAAETSVADKEAELVASKARVIELEAELATAKEAVAPSEDAEALAASRTFLGEQYVAVLSAAGEKDVKVPDAITEIVEGIKAHRAKLSAILPIGGVSLGADHEDKTEVKASLTSFKRKK